MFGLVYMEGWQTNKNRLDLAKTLLDEAKKRNEKYPPLQNAYGLYWMHKGSLNQALQSFQAAVEGDPKFVEARINAGLLTLELPQVRHREGDVREGRRARAEELRRDDRPGRRAARPQRSRRRGGAVQEGAATSTPRAATPTTTSACSTRTSARTSRTTRTRSRRSAERRRLQAGQGLLHQFLEQAGRATPTRPRRRRTSRTATRS